MPQGWDIDVTAKTITFYEPPANTAAIVVKQFGAAGYNATDLWSFSAWNPGFGYPGEVEFYSDRLFWACSVRQPQTLWATQTGNYVNFGRHTPSEDTDGITMTINARQVNPIRELIPMDKLIIMTASAEVLLTTGADEIVAPGKVGFSFQSYFGSGRIAAQVVGNQALFLQGRGFVLRDLGFQLTSDGYTGNDLTVYASHLLEGFTVVDMAYQQVPYSAVWLVRSDGALISVTYLREQEVVGWALHTTDGLIRTICTIPNGDENAVYIGVERMIEGVRRRYIEKLAKRRVDDVRYAVCLDSALTYDGVNRPGVAVLSPGAGWTENDILTLQISIPTWVGASDIGDKVRLWVGTEWVEALIIGYVSSTVVEVQSIGTVPVALRGVAERWDLGRSTLSGFDHIEGKTVGVLGDGSVQQSGKVVAGGQIELDVPAYVATSGIPYRPMGQLLDLNAQGAETIRDRKKLIPKVSFLVKDTRGLKVGPDETRLEDVKTEWQDEAEGVIPLVTGLTKYDISLSWDDDSSVVFVQEDPLPATVLAVMPHLEVGG